jgi:predicted SAM-dependent methyltransferase
LRYHRSSIVECSTEPPAYCLRKDTTLKLHIGAGTAPIEGWLNLDIAAYPGIDHVLDVRSGLPFQGVRYIFAEHFIEHLTLEEGLAFMRECRRVLRDDGILRVSTPNLDWVWLTHYKPPAEMVDDEPLVGCLEMNRAFHGWGHQFLYNTFTLSASMRAAGFDRIESHRYGESRAQELRGLERHERHADRPEAPSVVVVEASGSCTPDCDFERRIHAYVRDAAAR